jgi:hypothetical protein
MQQSPQLSPIIPENAMRSYTMVMLTQMKTNDCHANEERSATPTPTCSPKVRPSSPEEEIFSMMDDIPFLYLDAASATKAASTIIEAHSTEEELRSTARSGRESPTSAIMISTPCNNTNTWDGRASHNFPEQDTAAPATGGYKLKLRMRLYHPKQSMFDSELISNIEDMDDEDSTMAATNVSQEHPHSRKVLVGALHGNGTKVTPPSTPQQLNRRYHTTPPPVKKERRDLTFVDFLFLPALEHDEEGMCMPFLSCS